jgi:hypothetical protein
MVENRRERERMVNKQKTTGRELIDL